MQLDHAALSNQILDIATLTTYVTTDNMALLSPLLLL